jgi:S-adenosylmethionine:tRNA ribosyltransferase-isomerase
VRVDDFDYELPVELVAQEAIEPRHDARLLVTATMEDRTVADLPALLRPGDLLVVNRTRVRAARLLGTRAETGGAIEALLLRRVDDHRWEVLLRPSRRIRPGVELRFDRITGEVLSVPEEGVAVVGLAAEGADVDDLLPEVGTVPLPPYFHGELPNPERYQTVFAKDIGSAAAPTAGLHFTRPLLDRLAAAGIALAEVALDVGLDTFRPMTVDLVAEHRIHRERYEVPDETAVAIADTRRSGGRVVAVGTTVVRTLETAAGASGSVSPGEGWSELFIVPGHRFSVVDAMLTNFHAPRTTLVALFAAAIGPAWRDVYRTAVERRYRFLSFGDAMLVDPVGAVR